MVHPQAGGVKLANLRGNLSIQLVAQGGQEEILETQSDRAVAEGAVPIHQAGNFLAGQGGMPLDQGQVQPQPGHHHGQGQALYSGLTFGAGGAAGAWISGFLVEGVSTSAAFWGGAVAMAVALAVSWRGLNPPPQAR